MAKTTSRRNFLRTAPVAAAAGLALAEPRSYAAAPAPEKFQYFPAETLADDKKALQATPGNNNLVTLPAFTMVMTTEVAHSAKEFEWHEGRDHIVYVTGGTTLYEVGGTPKGTHGNAGKAGEFLAPESEGATTLTMKSGDVLIIPRGTPHKRSTADSVTFILISPQGMLM